MLEAAFFEPFSCCSADRCFQFRAFSLEMSLGG